MRELAEFIRRKLNTERDAETTAALVDIVVKDAQREVSRQIMVIETGYEKIPNTDSFPLIMIQKLREQRETLALFMRDLMAMSEVNPETTESIQSVVKDIDTLVTIHRAMIIAGNMRFMGDPMSECKAYKAAHGPVMMSGEFRYLTDVQRSALDKTISAMAPNIRSGLYHMQTTVARKASQVMNHIIKSEIQLAEQECDSAVATLASLVDSRINNTLDAILGKGVTAQVLAENGKGLLVKLDRFKTAVLPLSDDMQNKVVTMLTLYRGYLQTAPQKSAEEGMEP